MRLSSAEVGLRTEKTAVYPYGWKLTDKVPFDEVCVVYLGGDGATHDSVANGYAKQIEKDIELTMKLKVPVYSVKYQFGDNLYEWSRRYEFVKHRQDLKQDSVDRVNAYVSEEDKNPRYIDELYYKLLADRISVDKGEHRLSTEEACRRIRMITFVTHCHGAYVIQKLEDRMQTDMKRLGYNTKERKIIQKQMVVLAHAPAAPLGISKSNMIGFKSVYDFETPVPNNWFNTYIERRVQEEKRRFMAEKFHDEQGIEDNRWFDFKPCFFQGKQGNFFLIKQKFEWNRDNGPARRNLYEHGSIRFCVSDEQTSDGKMMASFGKAILFNVINNSNQQRSGFVALPPMNELILPPVSRLREEYLQLFEKLCENAKKFRTETYSHARACLRQSRMYR